MNMDRSEFEHVFHSTSKLFDNPTDNDSFIIGDNSTPEIILDNNRHERNLINHNRDFIVTDEIEQIPTTEIDLFESNVYKYFKSRGFTNILIAQIVNLFFVTFLISFIIFLLVCIDVSGLLSIHDPSHFYALSTYINLRNLAHMRWYMAIATTLFVIFLAWRIMRVSFDIHKMYRIKRFYEVCLQISDFELSTIRWQSVIERLREYQENTNFYTGSDDINVHNMANRILKKENYMIAMINNNIFDFKIPFIKKWWDYPFLTKSMEWNLQYGIINYFFDDRMKLKREMTSQHNRLMIIDNLRKRVRLIVIVNVILLPFIFMLYLFWTVFENGEEIFKSPGRIMKRTWNTYAQWKFRDFNEFPHVLEERMRLSEKYGDEYISQFSSHWLATCAKFISFVMSTFLASLFFLSLLNDATLFNLEISTGKSVFWYIGIFSTILLISRGLEVKKTIFSPQKKMKKLGKLIHYIPNDWVEKANTQKVKTEISRLFEYRFIILGKELIGMLLNPLLMWFNLDSNVEKIVDFMRDYTFKHPQLGNVCKFGLFDGSDGGDSDESGEFNNIINSTQVANIFDVEAQLNNNETETENQKKLHESVRNFNENFPVNSGIHSSFSNLSESQKKNDNNNINDTNSLEHIMNSAMFQMSENERNLLSTGSNLINSEIPVDVMNSTWNQSIGVDNENNNTFSADNTNGNNGNNTSGDNTNGNNTNDKKDKENRDSEEVLFQENELQIEEAHNTKTENASPFPFNVNTFRKI